MRRASLTRAIARPASVRWRPAPRRRPCCSCSNRPGSSELKFWRRRRALMNSMPAASVWFARRGSDPLEMTMASEYPEQTRAFAARARELGLPDLSRYYWYHTIDLGDGLVTPGLYDYRETLTAFPFPRDMRGMTVLDVGSATGFFAFEFERRGARAISVELPSLRDLDRFLGQSVESSLRKIEGMLLPDSLDPSKFVRHNPSERDLFSS